MRRCSPAGASCALANAVHHRTPARSARDCCSARVILASRRQPFSGGYITHSFAETGAPEHSHGSSRLIGHGTKEYSLERISLYSQPSPPLSHPRKGPHILSTECAHHYRLSLTRLRRCCSNSLSVRRPSRPPVSWRASCVLPTGSSCSTTPSKCVNVQDFEYPGTTGALAVNLSNRDNTVSFLLYHTRISDWGSDSNPPPTHVEPLTAGDRARLTRHSESADALCSLEVRSVFVVR